MSMRLRPSTPSLSLLPAVLLLFLAVLPVHGAKVSLDPASWGLLLFRFGISCLGLMAPWKRTEVMG